MPTVRFFFLARILEIIKLFSFYFLHFYLLFRLEKQVNLLTYCIHGVIDGTIYFILKCLGICSIKIKFLTGSMDRSDNYL